MVDIIGFLIGFIALTFIFFRRLREDRMRRNNPAEWEREEAKKKKNLKRLLKAMDIETDEEDEDEELEEEMKPRKTMQKPAMLRTTTNPMQELRKPMELPAIPMPKVLTDRTTSPIDEIFRDTESARKAIIAREVLDSPRAFRPYEPLQ